MSGSPFSQGQMVDGGVYQDANTGGYISDVSLAFDSEGGPLISVIGRFRHGANVLLREIQGEWAGYNHKNSHSSYVNFTGSTVAGIEVDGDGTRPRYDPKLGLWLPQQTTLLHLLFHGLRFRPVPARRELGTERLRLLRHVSLTYAFDTAYHG